MPDDGGELPVTRALGDVRMKALDDHDRCKPELQVGRAAHLPPTEPVALHDPPPLCRCTRICRW